MCVITSTSVLVVHTCESLASSLEYEGNDDAVLDALLLLFAAKVLGDVNGDADGDGAGDGDEDGAVTAATDSVLSFPSFPESVDGLSVDGLSVRC